MAPGAGRWDRIGRAAASLGVILSLVFVGLQVRQAATFARAQTRQALSEGNTQALQAIAENRDLARAWSYRFPPRRSGLGTSRPYGLPPNGGGHVCIAATCRERVPAIPGGCNRRVGLGLVRLPGESPVHHASVRILLGVREHQLR